ncbi:MAG: hypothetical protein H8F28_21535, partial [Fibrella sp.]|nr:hypothetical protein [Armatimonadota bacterium]
MNKSEHKPLHPDVEEWVRLETRRQFLRRGGNVLGMAALSSLGLGADALAAARPAALRAAACRARHRPSSSGPLPHLPPL